ncbi:hypothetical protein GCM10007925_00960 [Sphingomonas astaxanthinifaciens DSM 22298]|uniref:Uncharacterized protein n=1 Tax=Sphingomonas astaxanthinifaciens DSM 22298 TaxID=1123267 RepID=A0ABQ5Z409_9SPHN|nr:hypothetical protein GCM10007925_00960 [Sphingomonas astaxanthinifaciens DSM 22298]
MADEGPAAARGGFGLGRPEARRIAPSERIEQGHRPGGPRRGNDIEPFEPGALARAAGEVGAGKGLAAARLGPDEPPEQREERGPARRRVGFLVEDRLPGLGQRGELGAGEADRGKLGRDPGEQRLGRGRLGVERGELVVPPGELDRAERRLARPERDLGQPVVEREQGIEGGPARFRPVQPDEVAVPHATGRRARSACASVPSSR